MTELLDGLEQAVRLTAFWREHGDARQLAEAEANEARIRAQVAKRLR